MSLDFLSKDFNWGGGGVSSSLGKICFLQIVKPGKFGEEEKQAVLLKKKKKKKKVCLNLPFLKKTKQNKTQHSFMKHFFSKVFALEHFFLLTHAYLSKQTFIPFCSRV